MDNWTMAIEKAVSELTFERMNALGLMLQSNQNQKRHHEYKQNVSQAHNELCDRLPGEVEALNRLDDHYSNFCVVSEDIYYRAGLRDGIRLAFQLLGIGQGKPFSR